MRDISKSTRLCQFDTSHRAWTQCLMCLDQQLARGVELTNMAHVQELNATETWHHRIVDWPRQTVIK